MTSTEKIKERLSKFLFRLFRYRMAQTGPKYLLFRKFKFLQEKSFEVHMLSWKQCLEQCHNPKEITSLTRMRLGLIHLRGHKLTLNSYWETLP